MRKLFLNALISGTTLIVTAQALFAQSCPMCKESMTQAGAKLSDGFYISIMSMFSLPFAIGGVISAVVFKSWFDRTHPDSKLPFHQAFRQALKERKEAK